VRSKFSCVRSSDDLLARAQLRGNIAHKCSSQSSLFRMFNYCRDLNSNITGFSKLYNSLTAGICCDSSRCHVGQNS